MKKVAYNACYGGFSISKKAIAWLIENEKDTLEKDGLLDKLHTDTFSYVSDGLRSHPSLIKVIETLGQEANGMYARLSIKKLDDDALYRITEYDGFEDVETPNQLNWSC
jgi:hypothetical protein